MLTRYLKKHHTTNAKLSDTYYTVKLLVPSFVSKLQCMATGNDNKLLYTQEKSFIYFDSF